MANVDREDMCPGIIPNLISPGLISPGQLGSISVLPAFWAAGIIANAPYNGIFS